MILPLNANSYAENRIDFFLKLAIRKRESEGISLNQVTLKAAGPRHKLGISDLASPPCALWYALHGYPREQTDAGTRFGFDTGHLLESYILDLLEVPSENRQIHLEWPYSLAPAGRIQGHPDGFFQGILQGGPCVIECKATGGYSFNKKVEEGADKSHLEQAFCYAAKLKAPWIILIYANREAKKSTDFYKIFAYRINDMTLAKKAVRTLFHEHFLPVLMAEKRPAPPTKPVWEYGSRGWRCRPDKIYYARGREQQQVGYCSYRPICPEAQGYLSRLREAEKAKAAAA